MKILHDIHTHNIFSSCCTDKNASTEAYIRKERELGIKVFGLSNHIWDESVKGASYWYQKQTITKAEEAKNAFSKADPSMRVLFGAETEYYAYKGILGMSAEGAKRFDYLLIPHSHLHMRNEVMADFPEIREAREAYKTKLAERFPELSPAQIKRMGDALKEADLMPLVPEMKTDIKVYINTAMIRSFHALLDSEELSTLARIVPVSVAHPFSPCGIPHAQKTSYLCLIGDEVFAECFHKAAKAGIYVELNVGAIREVSEDLDHNEMIRMFAIAKKEGCQFTFGTDAHSVKALEGISFGDQIAQKLELTPADIAEHVRDGIGI